MKYASTVILILSLSLSSCSDPIPEFEGNIQERALHILKEVSNMKDRELASHFINQRSYSKFDSEATCPIVQLRDIKDLIDSHLEGNIKDCRKMLNRSYHNWADNYKVNWSAFQVVDFKVENDYCLKHGFLKVSDQQREFFFEFDYITDNDRDYLLEATGFKCVQNCE